MNKKSHIDPIVPFLFYANREKEMFAALRNLRQNYGLRRFLFTFPGLGVRLTGFPEPAIYEDFGRLLLKAKQTLAGDDIELGWWCAPTLKSGKGKFQNVTSINGHAAEISSCPLDLGFEAALAGNIGRVAALAQPFMIAIEDDFELSNHPGVNFGCFCPLHLEEFAKRAGRVYSREELLGIFGGAVTPESMELRRRWAELTRDTMVGLSEAIRTQVDRSSPATRMMLCQPGCCDWDGDMTEAVAAALAGETRPAVRLFGVSYSSDSPSGMPGEIFHFIYSRQHLPADFELFHESDTYPHTRFFLSAVKLRSLMTTAFAAGLEDSLFYTTQYLDDPTEESGYSRMLTQCRSQFEELKTVTAGTTLQGCEMVFRPDAHVAAAWPRHAVGAPGWADIVGRCGIPFTTEGGKVKLLSGPTAAVMSEAEITALLSGAVFLDGESAAILARRGFADLLGAKVTPGGKATFCFEGINPESRVKPECGSLIYNFIFAPAGAEGGGFYVLEPLPGAEVATHFLDPREQPIQAGMTLFENRLGGRIAITAFELSTNRSSAIFCYRKRHLLKRTLEWLGGEPLPVTVAEHPNVFCLCSRSVDGAYEVLTLINLSADRQEEIPLETDAEYRNGTLTQLTEAGEWRELAVRRENGRIVVPAKFEVMIPVILKITRKG